MNEPNPSGTAVPPWDPRQEMNLLVIGPGAVGLYVGGSLAFGNHRVVFLGTPGSADKLSQEGIHLDLGRRSIHLPSLAVADHLGAALAQGPFHAAILTVKAYDTPQIAVQLENHHRDFPPLLCLQNGVDNEPLLASVLGEGQIIAGTLTSAVSRDPGGRVILQRKRGLGLAASHPHSDRLWEALNQADLNPRRYDNPHAMKWSKLLTNLLANATAAILDMAPSEIFAHPGLYRLEQAQFREALIVMKALGVPVVDLPGVPMRLLALTLSRLPAGISRPLLRQILGKGRGDKMPSLHIDLHHGQKKSEVTFLNGAVVSHGNRQGVETPVNRTLTETLLGLSRRELKIETFAHRPDRLLALF